MPSRRRPRRAPTASVKRCSRFQRRPSGSRTGRFTKRWHSSSTIFAPSKRPQTTRPLEAPKSMAAYSVKVEDLLDPFEPRLRGKERRHLRLPACVHLGLLHRPLGGLEIVRLEVADQPPVGPQEQRVVAPISVRERREHLRPDGPVTLAVLVKTIRAHTELEADTFHGARDRDRLEVELVDVVLGEHGGLAEQDLTV